MGLLDDIEASTRRPGYTCQVATILGQLDEADQAELSTALTGEYHASAIGRVLRARGFKIKDNTLTRHRRGECQCQA